MGLLWLCFAVLCSTQAPPVLAVRAVLVPCILCNTMHQQNSVIVTSSGAHISGLCLRVVLIAWGHDHDTMPTSCSTGGSLAFVQHCQPAGQPESSPTAAHLQVLGAANHRHHPGHQSSTKVPPTNTQDIHETGSLMQKFRGQSKAG